MVKKIKTLKNVTCHEKVKKVPSPQCSLCNSADETLLHILYTCNITKRLLNKLQYLVSQNLYIPEISPKSALFRFFNIGNQKQRQYS